MRIRLTRLKNKKVSNVITQINTTKIKINIKGITNKSILKHSIKVLNYRYKTDNHIYITSINKE